MSAIQPPPLEPSNVETRSDNAEAIAALRSNGRKTARASTLALLGFGAVSLVAGAVSALTHRKTRNKVWYRSLRKPAFTPRPVVFPIVWSALYASAAISAWRVWRAKDSPERSRALSLWGTQLAMNAAWSPLFFGAHRPKLALADLGGNTATLGAYALAAAKVDRTAAVLVAPYLGWLGFSAAMNGGLVSKNAWRLRG